MKEIVELRTTFGGGDGKAINKHSVRFYEWPGIGFFELDRTLDGSPPFFELRDLMHDPRKEYTGPTYIPECLPVDGERCWGSGLSWPKAEALAKIAIEAKCAELNSD